MCDCRFGSSSSGCGSVWPSLGLVGLEGPKVLTHEPLSQMQTLSWCLAVRRSQWPCQQVSLFHMQRAGREHREGTQGFENGTGRQGGEQGGGEQREEVSREEVKKRRAGVGPER